MPKKKAFKPPASGKPRASPASPPSSSSSSSLTLLIGVAVVAAAVAVAFTLGGGAATISSFTSSSSFSSSSSAHDDDRLHVEADFLDADECDRLVGLFGDPTVQKEEGMVGYHSIDKGVKRSVDTTLDDPRDPKWRWLFRKVEALLRRAEGTYGVSGLTTDNTKKYGSYGMKEPLRVHKYEAWEGGGFSWHTDSSAPNLDGGATAGEGQRRVLSVTVQLTDGAEYEGGDLHIGPQGNVTRTRGAAVIYPAYMVHKVSNVTAGTRVSLVAHFLGTDAEYDERGNAHVERLLALPPTAPERPPTSVLYRILLENMSDDEKELCNGPEATFAAKLAEADAHRRSAYAEALGGDAAAAATAAAISVDDFVASAEEVSALSRAAVNFNYQSYCVVVKAKAVREAKAKAKAGGGKAASEDEAETAGYKAMVPCMEPHMAPRLLTSQSKDSNNKVTYAVGLQHLKRYADALAVYDSLIPHVLRSSTRDDGGGDCGNDRGCADDQAMTTEDLFTNSAMYIFQNRANCMSSQWGSEVRAKGGTPDPKNIPAATRDQMIRMYAIQTRQTPKLWAAHQNKLMLLSNVAKERMGEAAGAAEVLLRVLRGQAQSKTLQPDPSAMDAATKAFQILQEAAMSKENMSDERRIGLLAGSTEALEFVPMLTSNPKMKQNVQGPIQQMRKKLADWRKMAAERKKDKAGHGSGD
eukprot:g6201.t1